MGMTMIFTKEIGSCYLFTRGHQKTFAQHECLDHIAESQSLDFDHIDSGYFD
jgi:hypothetical protein